MTTEGTTAHVIAANVRRFRVALGLSQKGLASAAGLGDTMVTAIENGWRGVTSASLDKLCAALSCTPAVLVTDPAAPPCRWCGVNPHPGYTCGDCNTYTPKTSQP